MTAKSTNALSEDHLDALQGINARLHAIEQIDDLCWTLTDWVSELCDLDDCVIYLRVGNVLTQMAALGEKRDDADSREIVRRMGVPIGSGIVGAAAQTKEPIYVADTATDDRYVADVYPGASEFAVPFLYRGDVLGVLDVESRQTDGISNGQKQLLRTFAVLAAPHIAELRRTPDLQPNNYGEVVAELAHNAIGKGDDLKKSFANITERAARTLRVSRANLWLFEQDPNALVCQDEYRAETRSHHHGQTIDTQLIPAYVEALSQERVIMASDARSDPRTIELTLSYMGPSDIQSMLDAPIRLDGKVVGVLCLEHMHNPRHWTQEEASFVATLADLATIALASHQKALAEAGLIQAQKMESLGRLAGGIAHDFNNLLTVISGAVDTIEAKAALDASNLKLLHLIGDASQRAAKLTKNLMAFGGQQQLQLQSISTLELVENLRDLISGIIREDIEVSYVYGDVNQEVAGDPGLLEQVLLNLVINAEDAMPNGGKLTIKVMPSSQDDRVGISVSDTGTGMSDTIRSRIFDPFFTTKQDVGTGLGLSISLGIVHQHGGSLTCVESSTEGSRFELWLPTVTPAHYEDSTKLLESPPANYAAWPQQVLFVEDETGVREVVTDMLLTIGITPQVAASPAEALEIAQNNSDVELLISDVVMPGMRGPDLYQAALMDHPKMYGLFISGYSKDLITNIPIGNERVSYLAKPFTLAQLQLAIDQIRISRQKLG